ncbi:unnamed protein product [Pleuronectes platessa]|uniref:Uncharacterized protein n=1 Tax=Pleuronectes platessa TaxID=8262 RepID=A0A9N7UDC7_PLEPL|nr:unnamed protein product [Pleuronectes platessa]
MAHKQSDSCQVRSDLVQEVGQLSYCQNQEVDQLSFCQKQSHQPSPHKISHRVAQPGGSLISKWAIDRICNDKTKSLHNSPQVVLEGCSLDYSAKLPMLATHSHQPVSISRNNNQALNHHPISREAFSLGFFHQVQLLQHSSSQPNQTSHNLNKQVADNLFGGKLSYLNKLLPLQQSHSRVDCCQGFSIS